MIIGDGNDLLALLVFVARVANAIAPFLATVCGSRRHAARGDQAAARPRDVAHWPQTPARAIHHPPIGQRLCRRSCNEWPVCHWCRVVWEGTSTASPWRAPRR